METAKEHERRLASGWYAAHVVEPGLDVGCGGDPLWPTFRQWDQKRGDGDATLLAGVPSSVFATVYASHVLEHLADPLAALRRWWEVLKPGGRLIVVVPHRDLYEKRHLLPSRWNGDHKTYWLPDQCEPPCTFALRMAILLAVRETTSLDLAVLAHDYDANGDAHSKGSYSIEAIARKPM